MSLCAFKGCTKSEQRVCNLVRRDTSPVLAIALDSFSPGAGPCLGNSSLRIFTLGRRYSHRAPTVPVSYEKPRVGEGVVLRVLLHLHTSQLCIGNKN